MKGNKDKDRVRISGQTFLSSFLLRQRVSIAKNFGSEILLFSFSEFPVPNMAELTIRQTRESA